MISSAIRRRIAESLTVSLTLLLATMATAALNLGPEQIVQAAGADLMVPGYSVPSLVDWNEDELPDLLVGEGSGTIGPAKVRVYLNQGTAAAPLFNDFVYAQSGGRDLNIPGSGCLGCFPRAVHWDGDGRKDLLLGSALGEVYLYLNVGTDAAPEFGPGMPVVVGEPGSEVPIDIGARATPSLVDWNGDGRKDLVSGGLDGRIHIFVNEGTDTAPIFLVETFATTGAGDLEVPSLRSSPVVCDLDDDGCKDILSGNTEGQLFFYRNSGTDTAPVFGVEAVAVTADGVPIDLPSSPRSRPFVGDWTGDGRLDVLVGAGDGLVHLYEGVEPTIAAPPVVAAAPVSLLPPWPNPANPRVSVAFSLARTARVSLAIWDVRGRRVTELADGWYDAGEHTFVWNGVDAAGRASPSGAYLARLVGPGPVQVRKILLAR